MFTGIVEELGEVTAVEKLDDASRFRLRGPVVTEGAKHGDSIAVNGVCLTVVDLGEHEFTADVMAETLNRSSLGALATGSRVNLERPMALGGRLGGHIVQGHVDGTGRIIGREVSENWEIVKISLPAELTRYVVEKGSITVDGVSLTVVDAGPDYFTISLIPTTLALTTLGIKEPGDPVNLEVDVIAKYVERLLGNSAQEPGGAGEVSALHWLNSEAFTLFDQHIIWSDMIGNTIGLIALTLGWLRSVWTWPAQLLSGVVLVAANVSVHQAGSVGKQLVVVAVAVWGWQQWTRGRQQAQDGSIAVRFATWRERGYLLGGAALGTLAVGGLFTAFPSLSWSPWADAYIFAGTLVAMLAQARGMVEFWFAWLLVDLVGVPLNFHSGLAFSGLIYVVYGALVLWGMRDWWLRTRTPALEGATA